MKRLLTIALSVLALGLGSLQVSQAADTVGTIDYAKLVSSYNKAQLFNADMKAKEADLKKMEAEFVKQIREAKAKQPNNPVAVDQLQKSLEDQMEVKINEYRDTQQTQAQNLESAMNTAIQSVAQSKNLSIILDKQAVLIGGTDITNDVLAKLNAGGTTTTKAPASKK